MLGRDGSYVGGRNPLVCFAGMLRRLVSPRRMVSVGTANVEDRRDLLWIVADELVRVVLTAEPQIINDVVHHDGLSEHRCWALCDQATTLTPPNESNGDFSPPIIRFQLPVIEGRGLGTLNKRSFIRLCSAAAASPLLSSL